MSSVAAPDGYALVKVLRDSARSRVLLVLRESDGREVVLKSYHRDRNRSGSARQVQRELDAMRRGAGPGVPRALDLLLGESPPLLVLERVPGVALSHWIRDGIPTVEAFLSVALQLLETLGRIHSCRLIHRDVTPGNVLVDPVTLETHLIDFGLARPIGSATRSDERAADTLVGTLAYIAPEQTGRMNRGADFRSDLYSTGATLYHVLTGRRPFESNDPLELIHSHIARVPPDPASVRPGLPEPLARLLLKLLRKDPEERYQSAGAVRADLAALEEQLRTRGAIDAGFVLGSREAPDRPRFSAKLHGRTAQIARLHALYARCAAGEHAALVLRGEAGSGKSALVSELRPALAESGGYLTVGKFDAYQERPYAGWVTALESLAEQLLVESDERLARWRSELRAGLGNVAQALVDLVPDLAFILGDVPRVPDLGPRETQARLSLALQRFLAACASPEHPLVLFLDDLQWSDAGSRLLLEELLGSQPAALFLIAAYPAAKTDEPDRVDALLARLTPRGVAPEVLDIPSLASEHVLAMLAEALGQSASATRSLAELIERKTASNPLLVRQFVDHIHERGLLRYRESGWTYDLAEIASADVPDGAAALMTAKIRHLADDAREALALASVLGDQLSVELLCAISDSERGHLERALDALCRAGLLAPYAEGFRFVHDRIREAAQGLLAETERERLHCAAGRVLLERTSEAELAHQIFAIVDHLNRGLSQLPRELELRVIELNLLAGKRALATGAGATAAGYLALGRSLFQEARWSEQWGLGVDLYLHSAEAAFQARDFDAALALLDALDARPLSRIERAHSAAMRIRVLALVRRPDEVARYVLDVLRGFGIRWPLHPSRLRACLAMRLFDLRLRLFGTRRLLEPARTQDPDWLAPLIVLAVSGSVMLRNDMHLGVLANMLPLLRYVRGGYLTNPGFRLAGHAAYRYVLLGDAEHARRHAALAVEWSERIGDPIYVARTAHVVHTLVQPWIARRRQALAPMDRVAEAMREIGDQEFNYYGRFLQAIYLTLGGEAVEISARRLRELADSVKRSGHWFPDPEQCHRVYEHLVVALEPRDLDAAVAESHARSAAHAGTALHYTTTLWLLILCVYRRHDLAFAQSEAKLGDVFRVMPFVHTADFMLYRGLAAAALATRAQGSVRRRRVRALGQCLARMRSWAKAGPDFVHMVALLDAERARLRGAEESARSLYEQAAQRALAQEFTHHAALAYESRAQMLIERRRETEATASLAQAANLYREWGALPKAAQLVNTRGVLSRI